MRIAQGYISKSVYSFPFHQIYGLSDYRNYRHPSVFFGMYRYEDFRLLHQHREKSIIFWTGHDALTCKKFPFRSGLIRHVTAHPKVYQLIKKHEPCTLVKPSTFLNEINPRQLGPKIYAYCPNSMPDYHGKKIIDELRCGGYEIVIGDGQIPQNIWKHSQGGYYDDIFIGLCLSEFAGGGTSIIEMGLRGIKVVTNVFSLPNCIPWTCTLDVVNAIENEKKNIGTLNEQLANEVWESLDHEHKWLDV